MIVKYFIYLLLFFNGLYLFSQDQKEITYQLNDQYDFVFAILKYNGGGDWYEGKVGALELLRFVNKQSLILAKSTPDIVEIEGYNFFNYPFIYMTGHSTFELNQREVFRLRKYLIYGGMLFINDDYGLDKFVRKEIKKVFPKRKWVELPYTHAIFNIYFKFSKGAPKIHKHDGGLPLVYAIFQDNKIAILYIKNTDIGDGWAPYQVHKNSENIRRKALEFGFNIILYSMIQ